MKSYGFILFVALALFIAAGYCYDRGMMGVAFACGCSGLFVLLLGPFITDKPSKW